MIVEPDFTRTIDLPGNGPCPRPVDIDRTTAQLDRLVSLRIYRFAEGTVIDGEAEGDEVFVVLMRGAAAVGVNHHGERFGPFPLVADAGARAVFLPPHAAYRLTARTDCDVAYARVEPRAAGRPPRDFAPTGGWLDIADYASGMDLTLGKVVAGAMLPLPGAGGGASERFVHLRTDDGGAATIGGQRLSDWQSAIFSDGEPGSLAAIDGSVDVLTVTATAR